MIRGVFYRYGKISEGGVLGKIQILFYMLYFRGLLDYL